MIGYNLVLKQKYSRRIRSVAWLMPRHLALPSHQQPWYLTHWGRVTHICVANLTIIGSDNGSWSAPSHYLNQCWNIVNWTLRSKLQCNFNWISNIFIQENALENVVCEMASILSRPQCVKCGINEPLSSMKMNFDYMCHLSFKEIVENANVSVS